MRSGRAREGTGTCCAPAEGQRVSVRIARLGCKGDRHTVGDAAHVAGYLLQDWIVVDDDGYLDIARVLFATTSLRPSHFGRRDVGTAVAGRRH